MAKSEFNKTKLTLYVANSTAEWLKRFPFSKSVPMSGSVLLDWTVAQLKRGALSMHKKLTHHERVAIISSAKTLLFSTETPNLAFRIKDWFEMDEGVHFEWSNEQVSALTQKLETMTPYQAMGLLIWANGYWLSSVEEDIHAYADDTSYMHKLPI